MMSCEHSCTHETACLTSVPVFKGMDSEDLDTLKKVTRSRSFPKGTFIFREGETSDALCVVNTGFIKLTKINADGKEQIVRLLFPGDFFGLFSLLKSEKHYANAEALGDTVICFIEKKDFLQTMEKNADMALRFLLALNDKLYEADESVVFLGLMDVEKRLARALLLFHEKLHTEDGRFTLPITKKDLGGLIGTTPESISRKLQSFTSQKIITIEGQRHIHILEPDRLKQLAGSEAGY